MPVFDRTSLLSPLGQQMLASLPPRVRGSIDYLAVIHAAAREVELLEAAIEVIRAQFNPATADVLLDAWESMLGLPIGGPIGSSTTDRRNLVMARLRKLVTTGKGHEWETAVDQIVGPGWSYFERQSAPLSNAVPNPSFEYNTPGVAPPRYTMVLSAATSQVSTEWSDSGVQSWHLVTDPANVVGGGAKWKIELLDTGPGSAGAGILAVSPGDVIAVRDRRRIKTLAAGGWWNAYLTFTWYDLTGTFLSSSTTAAQWIQGAQVGQTIDVMGIFTAPPGGLYLRVDGGVSCLAVGQLDFFVDSVALFKNPPGGVMPPYADGDTPGWIWTLTAGNSGSSVVNPPDGAITVVLPYDYGSIAWLNAVKQIGDITDAHIQVTFLSTARFRWDLSRFDTDRFGT